MWSRASVLAKSCSHQRVCQDGGSAGLSLNLSSRECECSLGLVKCRLQPLPPAAPLRTRRSARSPRRQTKPCQQAPSLIRRQKHLTPKPHESPVLLTPFSLPNKAPVLGCEFGLHPLCSHAAAHGDAARGRDPLRRDAERGTAAAPEPGAGRPHLCRREGVRAAGSTAAGGSPLGPGRCVQDQPPADRISA